MMKTHNENLSPMTHAAHNRCFGCGPANPSGLQLEFLSAQDGTVVCPATIPAAFDGHPGYLHGGIIATLLDETMSKSVRYLGLTAMTRHMEVDFKRPVPSQVPIRMEGRVVQSEGKKHWAEAAILDAKGSILAQAKGLFIEVKPR
jgi:uncharacterized protein (TIGR00369 family)